jgi:hypothetical protein
MDQVGVVVRLFLLLLQPELLAVLVLMVWH